MLSKSIVFSGIKPKFTKFQNGFFKSKVNVFTSKRFKSLEKPSHIPGVPSSEDDFLECFNHFFDKAATTVNISPGRLQDLKTCNSILRVEFPFKVFKKKKLCIQMS